MKLTKSILVVQLTFIIIICKKLESATDEHYIKKEFVELKHPKWYTKTEEVIIDFTTC